RGRTVILPLATIAVQAVVVTINFFREPFFCLSRRRMVFSLSNKVFRNRCVLIACRIPFNASLLTSKNVSIVVHHLSLENKKRILRDNRHPDNFWLDIYFLISE